jgi:hypothetical protein
MPDLQKIVNHELAVRRTGRVQLAGLSLAIAVVLAAILAM